MGCGCGEDDKGLTAFGRDLVKRLNELGILVDLSHCGPKTALDAIEVATRPVVFTHAGVLPLNNHVRNKNDEPILAIAEKGGVIGFPSYAQFLDIHKTRVPSIIEYLEVIEHVVNLVGIDYVVLGLDFTSTWEEKDYDQAAKTYPEIYLDYNFEDTRLNGLRGIVDAFNVTRGLAAQGYTDNAILKVLGENFLRVFAEAWH